MKKDDIDYKRALENLYVLFHKLHPPILDGEKKSKVERKAPAR